MKLLRREDDYQPEQVPFSAANNFDTGVKLVVDDETTLILSKREALVVGEIGAQLPDNDVDEPSYPLARKITAHCGDDIGGESFDMWEIDYDYGSCDKYAVGRVVMVLGGSPSEAFAMRHEDENGGVELWVTIRQDAAIWLIDRGLPPLKARWLVAFAAGEVDADNQPLEKD